ncbi:MAG: hypothetical protein CVU89_06805 [Firmicutes bacterium HGW-Firmicutes-14]|nr:MAG: hypothetical protein CVU89_06805 [Firmicutes bacterium HGW-Firmicutes-14]
MINSSRSSYKWKFIYPVISIILLLLLGIAAYAENSGPDISNLYPVPNTTISPYQVEIRATASDPDGINPASTYIELDGEARTGAQIRTENEQKQAEIKYAAGTLSGGLHNIVLHIADKQGNYSRISWNFTVSVPDPAEPVQPRITGIQPQGSVTVAQPLISALVEDIDISTSMPAIYMTLDGKSIQPVTNKYSANSLSVEYRPGSGLAEGEHRVFLRVTAPDGQRVEESWSFSVASGGPEFTNPTEQVKPGQIATVRYPGETKLVIAVEDFQNLSLIEDTANLGIRKTENETGDYAGMVFAFVYGVYSKEGAPAGQTPDYSKGYFEFSLGERPDGQYTVRAEIANELGTVGQYEYSLLIRDKETNTPCTTCHYKKPYDHSTRNCEDCHSILGNSGQDCLGCHGSNAAENKYPWPHGPEVFQNPRPSTPTRCRDCHLESLVEKDPVPQNIYFEKDHYIID